MEGNEVAVAYITVSHNDILNLQKYHFALKGGYLMYYRSKHDHTPRKTIHLDDVVITILRERYVFRLKTQSYEVLLKTEKLSELQIWSTLLLQYSYGMLF
jgi:hypothetical protein